MPKVTVYIQDELWKRIKGSPAAKNVSQLIRKALETELGGAVPAVETEKARGIVARMRKEARVIYDVGARDGMDLAAELHWSDLDLLQEVGWDIDRWLVADVEASGREDARLAELLDQWHSDHEASLDYQGLPGSWWRSGSYKEGWLDALRGVWTGVMSDLRKPEEGVPDALSESLQ